MDQHQHLVTIPEPPPLVAHVLTQGRKKMLVLTRHTDESFLIGENIRITVIKVTGHDTIRIGIEAPKGTPVVRSELTTSCQQGETHENHDT